MVARGTIQLTSSSVTLDIETERVNLRTGLVSLEIPTTNSASTLQGAVFGRGREIAIEGWYAGTQTQIETWLAFFENWGNANISFQETAKYYPMHHPDNVSSGAQTAFYNVQLREMQWEFDNEEPTRIKFSLSLVEGTKIGPFAALGGGS